MHCKVSLLQLCFLHNCLGTPEPCGDDSLFYVQNTDHYSHKMAETCYRFRKEKGVTEEEGVEEAMGLKHLKMTFVYWAVGIGLGMGAFVGEAVCYKVKVKVKMG